jgi:hypothetical protein
MAKRTSPAPPPPKKKNANLALVSSRMSTYVNFRFVDMVKARIREDPGISVRYIIYENLIVNVV